MLLLKQTNGSLIHDGIRATECSWSDGGEMWFFLKLFLRTSSFEPQHKVLLISDEMIYCSDKPSPLKLLFPHLWEWGVFNVTFIYNSFTPANSLYSKSIIFAVQKISPSSYDDYWKEKKESDNSVLKNKMCGRAHNLKSYGRHTVISARGAVCFTIASFQVPLISSSLKTLIFWWEKKWKSYVTFRHHIITLETLRPPN